MPEIERLPVGKGLTGPATLPTELIHANPAAAAVRERIADAANATPATATCQRRSLVASEWRAMVSMAIEPLSTEWRPTNQSARNFE